jgi:hypothetical protein
MRLLLFLLTAALASCAPPPDSGLIVTGPTRKPPISRSDWKRLETQLRRLDLPHPAAAALAASDRASLAANMASPFIGQSRQFVLLSQPRERRSIGIILDRMIPADCDRFAALLTGDASDPHHARITTIEIYSHQPGFIGNSGTTLIYRSD